jgi:hypothetical protein
MKFFYSNADSIFVEILLNLLNMDKKAKGMYWLLFLVSIALSISVYLFVPSLTSVTLVPILTFLCKALDLI